MTVLQANFPGTEKIDGSEFWILGNSCHQQANGQVFVCVVTDLLGNILLSSQPTNTSRWVITRARVNTTRFWSASTAFIKCVCELSDPTEPLPPITTIEPYRPRLTPEAKDSDLAPANLSDSVGRDRKFPLGQMDEICVYLGYMDHIDQPITTNDLGSYLLRVFVGCIDTTIEAFSPNDGASFSISCRDRMKYLMDSIASFNGAESEALPSDLTGNKTSRKDVILAIARRAVGDLRGSKNCGITNCGMYIRDSIQSQGIDYTQNYDPFKNYKFTDDKITATIDGKQVDEDVYFLGGRTRNSLNDISVIPKFHIITGRMPYSNSSDLQSNYVVTERVPLEYIKQMSNLETVMTEVFVDHRTGDFWYCPRGTDVTGLNDSTRMFRTYFNRICPEEVSKLYSTGSTNSNNTFNGVHPCQMLILYREEQSTINWRSNIIVSKSNGDDSGEAMTLHLRVVPPRFDGRAFPCTYYTVNDPSINSSAEMVGVALAHARNVGKEVRAATAHLIGDPSLTPGEAIQIVGSMPKNSITSLSNKEVLDSAIKDRENFTEYYQAYLDLAVSLNSQVKQNTGTGVQPVNIKSDYITAESGVSITPSNSGGTNTESMCNITPSTNEESSPTPNNEKITFKEDPSTIWRLEGLIHRFNDGKPGFYTEIALVSPF